MSCVIVGAGLAGDRAAEALRAHGYEGPIVLVGEEPERPYERPPLSKDFLRRELAEDGLYLRPAAWYAERGIGLRLGLRATGLDLSARSVSLADGGALPFDQLLIATGTRVRRLQVPGADLDGVHCLRTRADATRLREALQRAGRVAVIGAGFIGAEVAASARALGRQVTVLEATPVPLARALGPRMGALCAALHRDHGVDLRLSCGVAGFVGSQRVEAVELASGERVPCDLVVVGVGVLPNTEWLEGSGVALDNGVRVNERSETNVAGVYAAGDVANSWNPLFGRRLRVEHYDNADNQGTAAGMAMAGVGAPYAPVPYFWSDQYDLTLQYVGHAQGDEELVVRGDLDGRSFTAFYLDEDLVRAAFSIGRPRDITAARRLIQSGKRLERAVLADEEVDLRPLSR